MSLKAPKTGKGFFLSRLAKEFDRIGIKVTADPKKKVDITLGVGKFIFPPIVKAILRLGDIHKDSNENYKKLNKRKKNALKIADGVIYQSKYSRKLTHSFIGKEKCPSTVIFNGASPEFYKDIKPKDSPFKYNFLASTRKWLTQKRLKQTIKAFKEADIPDSCLWIAGIVLGGEKKYKSKNIRFLGLLDGKELGSYYKLCDAMIDITFLSACPNNVVEALVAGCPVICGDQGGTIELTGGSWDIETKKYDFKPINLKKPPKIKMDELVRVIRFHTLGPPDRNFPNEAFERLQERLHIDTIAKKYDQFFRKVLDA